MLHRIAMDCFNSTIPCYICYIELFQSHYSIPRQEPICSRKYWIWLKVTQLIRLFSIMHSYWLPELTPKSSNPAYHSACLTNLKFMQWSSKDQEVKVGIVDGLVRFLGWSTYSLGKNYLVMILEDCMSPSLISNVLLRLLSSSWPNRGWGQQV